MNGISPRYQMSIVQNINDRLFELYKSYEDVANYLDKWHIVYDCYGDNENFYFYFKDEERKKLDVKKTLHHIDGETLLKIAIDLGVETPDYIPSIPVFKNELKSSYETASQTFEKAFKNVEEDPSLAVGLANSALESIIKEMLKDTRINVVWGEKDMETPLWMAKKIEKLNKNTTLIILKEEDHFAYYHQMSQFIKICEYALKEVK